MWVLLIIAAAVMLSGSSSGTTLQSASAPNRGDARLYQAMCELWSEGIYDPRALQLATAMTLRPELERLWRSFAEGAEPVSARSSEPYVWWAFVGGVANEVAARPSLLCVNRGRR